MYHGDIFLGDTINIKFTTRQFSTGAPFTLAGTPSVAAYPANSTTEVTAGITLSVDFDSRTGLNNVAIVATAANGYLAATTYTLVVTAGTVDSVSVVGEVVGSFSIEHRSTVTWLRKNVAQAGAAGSITLDAGASATSSLYTGLAVTILSGTGVGQSRVITGYTGSTKVATVVPNWTTNPSSDSVFMLTNANSNVAAWRLGQPNVLVSSRVDSSVGAMAANVLTATAINTGAITAAKFAAGAIDAAAIAANAIADTKIATGAFTAAKFAAGAFDAVWTVAARILTAATNITSTGGTTVPQTGDSFARLGAPVGADLSADVAAVKTVVDGIQTDLDNGTDGLGAIKIDTAAILVDTADIQPKIGTPAADLSADIAAVKVDTAAILVDTADIQPKLGTPSDLGGGATIGANLSDMAGATFLSATDALEAIRDRGDAAWTTGAGGSDRLLMVDTTIATLASQVSFTLAAGSDDNDAYNNCTIVVEDASTATQKAVGIVSDYVGSTKTVTLKYDPAIFTMAVSDKVYILAENALKSIDANRQLDVTAAGAVATLDGHTPQTGDSFARLGAPAGADVSADIAGVQSDTDNIQTRLPVGLVGGRMDSDIGAKTGNVPLSTQEKADVNTEVKDVTDTDTHVEPAQGAPPATASIASKIDYLYKNWRNRKTQTSTTWSLLADDEATVDHKSTVSDAAGVTTKQEIVSGP